MNGYIWAGLPQADREQYGDFVYRVVGQAAHTGYIPDSCGIAPIYMSDVARSVDLWRGRHLLDQTLVDQVTFKLGNGFSFSDYVECLCRLPIDAVVELVASDEYHAFQFASAQFAQSKYELDHLLEQYTNYRKLIDARILSISHMPRRSGGVARFSAFVSENAEDGVVESMSLAIQEGMNTAVPFLSLGYKVVKRVIQGEWPVPRTARQASEATAWNAASELHTLQLEGDRIAGQLIGDTRGGLDHVVKWARHTGDDVCVGS